jgi:hypothetical protein
MGVKVINTQVEVELDPGKTWHSHWNNASPAQAVWTANAVPVYKGDPSTGYHDLDTQLEVTRLWRRLKVVATQTGEGPSIVSETEIHFEVKNIGSSKARFIMLLSAAT